MHWALWIFYRKNMYPLTVFCVPQQLFSQVFSMFHIWNRGYFWYFWLFLNISNFIKMSLIFPHIYQVIPPKLSEFFKNNIKNAEKYCYKYKKLRKIAKIDSEIGTRYQKPHFSQNAHGGSFKWPQKWIFQSILAQVTLILAFGQLKN